MRSKRVTLDLQIPIPAGALQTLSRSIAAKVGERDAVELAKAAALKQFNQDLAHHDADISEIAAVIRKASIEAKVECESTMDDPVPGFKTTRRLDTGEPVGEPQPMEEADRQEELFSGQAVDLEKLGALPDTRDEAAPIKDTEPDANKGEQPPPMPPGWNQPEPPPEIEPGR